METNELRIGNCVLYDYLPHKIVSLTKVDASLENLRTNTYIDLNNISFEKVKPIELTEEECLIEGVRKGTVYGFLFGVGKTQKKCLSAIDAFADLINKLNGKGYWESNPLGYAYEFELLK